MFRTVQVFVFFYDNLFFNDACIKASVPKITTQTGDLCIAPAQLTTCLLEPPALNGLAQFSLTHLHTSLSSILNFHCNKSFGLSARNLHGR